MRKLVWSEFSSDSDTLEVSLLISPRTQSILLAALDYVQKEYVWSGDFDSVDGAMGKAIEEVIVQVESGTMSCVDVADCIDDNEVVQVALVQNLTTVEMINQLTTIINNNGFGNPNSINASQTTVIDRNPLGALQEEIKELANCNRDALWGGIREGIVGRLNDVTKDLLEDLNVIPTAAERLTIFIDTVPVMGDLAEGVALQITNFIPDILVLYESYESVDTLDQIACELFDLVCTECRYPTFEEVFTVYANHTLIGVAMNDLTLDAVATAILDLLIQTNEVAFFTMSVQALFILNLQAAFNGVSTTSAIVRWAELGEDSDSDNWRTLCSTCGGTYMLWTWNFVTQGQGLSYPDTAQNTSKAIFEAGKGWRAVNHSTGRRFDICFPHNSAWKIRAVAFHTTGAVDTGYNWTRRPTWGTTSGQTGSSAGSSNATWTHYFDGYASLASINEVLFFSQFAAGAAVWLDKVSILYDAGFSPSENVVPTEDVTPYA